MLWIIIGIVFLFIFIPFFRRIRDLKLLKSVTSSSRGTKSERELVLKLLKHGIPAQTIFHDLCIEKNNGNFSQIDIVVATTEGIIVFEVLKRIRKNNEPAPYNDKHEVIRLLEQAVENGENINNQEKHIEKIEDIIGTDRIYN